ncbi:serine/threonine-protein kinase Sgk2-like [Rana temporaria]|uniref:serine/threonine-protein kinase Sgk2-like n=1 Tax=Rana temporaria TaxID=8407 RepID=UPI001AAD0168|nr:serine/threonine-protein kinase Sgk2-like [Rana temporaria]
MMLLFSSQTCSDPSLSLISPQIFKDEPFDKAVDYFALGVTLFEAAFGIYPFNIKNPRASICQDLPRYPVGTDDVLVDFLNKLLCKDQKKRKVYIAKIRNHRFFRGINWEKLEAGKTHAPFAERRKDLVEEMVKTTLDLYERIGYRWKLGKKEQEQFMGFSFVSEEWKAIQNLKNTTQKKKLN